MSDRLSECEDPHELQRSCPQPGISSPRGTPEQSRHLLIAHQRLETTKERKTIESPHGLSQDQHLRALATTSRASSALATTTTCVSNSASIISCSSSRSTTAASTSNTLSFAHLLAVFSAIHAPLSLCSPSSTPALSLSPPGITP